MFMIFIKLRRLDETIRREGYTRRLDETIRRDVAAMHTVPPARHRAPAPRSMSSRVRTAMFRLTVPSDRTKK